MDIENNLFEIICKYNIDKHVPGYRAYFRAKELSKKFSHERPDGTEVVDLGYGENIARGQSSASEVMKDWMKSEGHRYNILWDQYHSIGVARSGSYWVQVFSF